MRPTVVVVGAGFGGLRAVRALRRAPVEVVLVDRHNYHLFQPLLYQVATAGLEPEQIARPVRAILRGQKNADFRLVEVTGLDLAQRQLVTDAGPIPYDYLVLAVGGETNFFGLDAVRRHGFALKDLPDALGIRHHVLRSFEQAVLEPDADRRRALLTFVVVGGGPTGVEMAGALSELIRLVLARDYPRLNIKDVRILLLEAADRLLGGFPPRLSEAAARTLWRKMVGDPGPYADLGGGSGGGVSHRPTRPADGQTGPHHGRADAPGARPSGGVRDRGRGLSGARR